MRALIIVVIMTAGLAGCAHRDQGGTTTESYIQADGTNGVGYAVPPERGGRPGGTGPGGSTIGGTGSAPDR